MFCILAACYETLVYHGHEYSICLHTLEHAPLKGEIYVGGRRMTVFTLEQECEVVIPTLTKTSSSSESEDDDDFLTCRQEETLRHHTNNGPLELMYKARHYKPFTNPYLVFEKVFGHDVFPQPPLLPQHEYDKQQWLEPSTTTATTTTSLPSIWTGSTIRKRDGTLVSTTSRTLHNTRVTKTETTCVDNKGKTHVFVQVTSESVGDLGNGAVNDMPANIIYRSCCQMEDTLLLEHEESSSACSVWPEIMSPCGWSE